MKGLVKYHLQRYFRGYKFVMPAAVFCLLLFSIYSVKPAEFVSGILSSGMFAFLIMVWTGAAVCGQEDDVSAQLLMLRVGSKRKYYFSCILFLMVIEASVSAAAVLFPVIQNMVYGGEFLVRPFFITDLLGGFCLVFLCAYAGGALGVLAHPGIIRERKAGIAVVFLLAIISLVKAAMITRIPGLKFVLWIIPPVSELADLFAGAEHFSIMGTAIGTGGLLISGAVLTAMEMWVLEKRGF